MQTKPNPQWTEVVEVTFQLDQDEGGYTVRAYNAQEEELSWNDDKHVGWYRPWATGERGALLETTATLRDRGYVPTARWEQDHSDSTNYTNSPLIRTFRRSE